MDSNRLLALLLRLAGTLMSLAFLAVVMPTDWMVATHAQLGLGELPRLAIVDYLTRSLSARYGFHGLLLLFVARDVVRYRGIVSFIGVTNIAFGLMMVAIDLHAGMPVMWTLSEGPPIAAFGVVLLHLNARVSDTRPS
jgi:hypothetical protein